MDKKLLLHICCAPCSIYPLEVLRGEGYEVSGFFFNPNIQPEEEHKLRKETLIKFAKDSGLNLTVRDDIFINEWQKLKDLPGVRCALCYELRMRQAASFARQTGHKVFTTTLLVSPYQNHEQLILAATKAAKDFGVDFLYKDFRGGFWQAQTKAKELGLYRQKYCGCVFSKEEAELTRKQKLNNKKITPQK